MDASVDWDSENNLCDTGGEHSNYPRKATKQLGHTWSLQREAGMSYSCGPPGNSAGPSGKQELPAELQGGDKETCDTYAQKQGESPGGQFVPSNTRSDLQSGDERLDQRSSERPRKPRATAKPRADDGGAVPGAVFGEAPRPGPAEAVPRRCGKRGRSSHGAAELRERGRARPPENSYRCPTCAKAFSRAANLRMHRLIHSGERPHKCPECDKGFIRTADVWRHLRNVHKIERSMVILAHGAARNPWSVVRRGRHGVEFTDRPRPENPKPREDDFKPYACPTCGKGFDKPNLLSKHKVIHREDKPYKCQECGMAFVQLLRLKRHQQTHSGARPFYCEECGGTFTRLASLQRHHRIHTGEKPYSCNFCGHSFTESGTLRRHERTHKSDKA